MRLNPQDVIDGRYRLVERIGSGGMADVWRANDSELGRDVAIKVLHENFSRDAEFVERFRREASSAASLQHPNVVAVYDRGDYEDTYYIAMELVEGSSLRDLINRGLEPGEAVEVTRQVLTAASFAHGRGIVHRDLKPMNVLIDRHGRIRVTDFGIARAGNSEITQTGSVMGTAQYLSPEQAQGMEVTPAADIYSIGVMLFEMLTGRVPFDGENAVAIAMKQVAEAPPAPSSINPAVSPALDAVVLKALAKEPANRFASAVEMSAALDAAEADPQRSPGHTQRFEAIVAEYEEEPDNRRRNLLIAALIALLLAGAALAYFLTRPDEVRIPDVTGKTEVEATLALQEAGFTVDADRVQNPAPADQVIESDPREGTKAEEGSTVTITVSLGPGDRRDPARRRAARGEGAGAAQGGRLRIDRRQAAVGLGQAGRRDQQPALGRVRHRPRRDGGPQGLDRRRDRDRAQRGRDDPRRGRERARAGRLRAERGARGLRRAREPGARARTPPGAPRRRSARPSRSSTPPASGRSRSRTSSARSSPTPSASSATPASTST